MNRIGEFRKMAFGLSAVIVSALLFVAMGDNARADKTGDIESAKIDPALLKVTYVPVFVRMNDQLIGKAGEYEKFCEEHQKQKRSELRPWVIKTLKQKSADSWKKVSKDVEHLEKEGLIKDVQRFWIVNGFACKVKVTAIDKLSAIESAEFVYLDQNPPATTEPPQPLEGDGKEIVENVLKEWKDDSNDELSTEGLEIPWNLKRIQADAVWKEEKITGKGVVVAVADSGIMNTPSLIATLWKNPKTKMGEKDEEGFVDDFFGYDFQSNSPWVIGDDNLPHGSMCAGIIAGRPLNKSKMLTGIAPRSHIMVVRGNGFQMYQYVLTHGADVLSMSYGSPPAAMGNYRGLYRTAFEHLTAAGVLATGGVGNEFTRQPKEQQIVSPKDIPCVIGTGGVMEDGTHGKASSAGPCYWDDIKFYSDYPKGKPLQKPDLTAFFGGYPVWGRPNTPQSKVVCEESKLCALVTGPQGNSFSCPHTAGVAALVICANPELNTWEVKKIMEQTCKDLGNKEYYGAGLIQALDAVKAAKKVKK